MRHTLFCTFFSVRRYFRGGGRFGSPKIFFNLASRKKKYRQQKNRGAIFFWRRWAVRCPGVPPFRRPFRRKSLQPGAAATTNKIETLIFELTENPPKSPGPSKSCPTSRAKINFNFLRENIFVKTFARKHFREKPRVQKTVGSYIPYKGRLSGAVFFFLRNH